MSQEKQILQALKEGAHLTPDDAKKRFGCGRLAARICDLRKIGHPIEGRMVVVPSGARVAQYWMERQA